MIKKAEYSYHLKAISTLIALLFTWNSIAFAFPDPLLTPVLEAPLVIPQEFGEIAEMRPALKAFSGQPFLIHIQDAHANPEAQTNIASLISYLKKTQKVDLVFVEAAIGNLDAKYLKFSPDLQLNQKIAAKLTEMGEMTGADLFLLKEGNALEFSGMEDARLYRKEIEHLKEVFSRSSEIEKWIHDDEEKLDGFLSKNAGKDLLNLLRTQIKWEKTRSTHLLLKLNQFSRRRLNSKDQVEFPNLVRLLKLKQEEGSVDVEKAKREWEEIAELNGQTLSFRARLSGSAGAEKRESSDFRISTAKSLDPRFRGGDKMEGITRQSLERLYAALKHTGFSFTSYPHFSKYAKHMIFQKELDPAQLSQEITRWCRLLSNTLVRTPQEKSAGARVRESLLLHKLLRLELSREEWEELKKREASLVKREAHDQIRFTLHASRAFYRLAEHREQAFQKNIRETLRAKKQSRAIVITGGFHSRAMSRWYAQQGWGYGVISPRFSCVMPAQAGILSDSRAHYIQTMLGRARKTIESSEAANVPQALSPAQLVELGLHPQTRINQREALAASLGEAVGIEQARQRLNELGNSRAVYFDLNPFVVETKEVAKEMLQIIRDYPELAQTAMDFWSRWLELEKWQAIAAFKEIAIADRNSAPEAIKRLIQGFSIDTERTGKEAMNAVLAIAEKDLELARITLEYLVQYEPLYSVKKVITELITEIVLFYRDEALARQALEHLSKGLQQDSPMRLIAIKEITRIAKTYPSLARIALEEAIRQLAEQFEQGRIALSRYVRQLAGRGIMEIAEVHPNWMERLIREEIETGKHIPAVRLLIDVSPGTHEYVALLLPPSAVRAAGEYLDHENPEVRQRAIRFLSELVFKYEENLAAFTPENLLFLAQKMESYLDEFQDSLLWEKYGQFFEYFLRAKETGKSISEMVWQFLSSLAGGALTVACLVVELTRKSQEWRAEEKKRRSKVLERSLAGKVGLAQLTHLATSEGLMEVKGTAPMVTEELLAELLVEAERDVQALTELGARELFRRLGRVRKLAASIKLDLSPRELLVAADGLVEEELKKVYLDGIDKELGIQVETPAEPAYEKLKVRLEGMKDAESHPKEDMEGLARLHRESGRRGFRLEENGTWLEQTYRLIQLIGEEKFYDSESYPGLAEKIIEIAKQEITGSWVTYRVRWRSVREAGLLKYRMFQGPELEKYLGEARDTITLDSRIHHLKLVLEEAKKAGRELTPAETIEYARVLERTGGVNEREKRLRLRRIWKKVARDEAVLEAQESLGTQVIQTVRTFGARTGLFGRKNVAPRETKQPGASSEVSIPEPLDSELARKVEEAFFRPSVDREELHDLYSNRLLGIKHHGDQYFLVYYFEGESGQLDDVRGYIYLNPHTEWAVPDLGASELIHTQDAVEALLPALARQRDSLTDDTPGDDASAPSTGGTPSIAPVREPARIESLEAPSQEPAHSRRPSIESLTASRNNPSAEKEKPGTIFEGASLGTDINSAAEEELMPVIASILGKNTDDKAFQKLVRRIIQGRPYRWSQDLLRVQGIGPGLVPAFERAIRGGILDINLKTDEGLLTEVGEIFLPGAMSRVFLESLGFEIPTNRNLIRAQGYEVLEISLPIGKRKFFSEIVLPVSEENRFYLLFYRGKAAGFVIDGVIPGPVLSEQISDPNVFQNLSRNPKVFVAYLFSDSNPFISSGFDGQACGVQIVAQLGREGILLGLPQKENLQFRIIEVTPKQYLGLQGLGLAHFDKPVITFPTVYCGTTLTGQTYLQALQSLIHPGNPTVIIGCGSGIDVLIASKAGAQDILALDINPIAVSNTRFNLSLHGETGINTATVLEADIFEHPELLQREGLFVAWQMPVSGIEAHPEGEGQSVIAHAIKSEKVVERFLEQIVPKVPVGTRFLLGMYEDIGHLLMAIKAGLAIERVSHTHLQSDAEFYYSAILFTKINSDRANDPEVREFIEFFESLPIWEKEGEEEIQKDLSKRQEWISKIRTWEKHPYFSLPKKANSPFTEAEIQLFRYFFIELGVWFENDVSLARDYYPDLKAQEGTKPNPRQNVTRFPFFVKFHDFRTLPVRKADRLEKYRLIHNQLKPLNGLFSIMGFTHDNQLTHGNLEGIRTIDDLESELKAAGFYILRSVRYHKPQPEDSSEMDIFDLSNYGFRIEAVRGEGASLGSDFSTANRPSRILQVQDIASLFRAPDGKSPLIVQGKNGNLYQLEGFAKGKTEFEIGPRGLIYRPSRLNDTFAVDVTDTSSGLDGFFAGNLHVEDGIVGINQFTALLPFTAWNNGLGSIVYQMLGRLFYPGVMFMGCPTQLETLADWVEFLPPAFKKDTNPLEAVKLLAKAVAKLGITIFIANERKRLMALYTQIVLEAMANGITIPSYVIANSMLGRLASKAGLTEHELISRDTELLLVSWRPGEESVRGLQLVRETVRGENEEERRTVRTLSASNQQPRLRAREIAKLFVGSESKSDLTVTGKSGQKYQLKVEVFPEKDISSIDQQAQLKLAYQPGCDVLRIRILKGDMQMGFFITNMQFVSGTNILNKFVMLLDIEARGEGIALQVFERLGSAFPQGTVLVSKPENTETLIALMKKLPDTYQTRKAKQWIQRAEAILLRKQDRRAIAGLSNQADKILMPILIQALQDGFTFDSDFLAQTLLGKMGTKAGLTHHQLWLIGNLLHFVSSKPGGNEEEALNLLRQQLEVEFAHVDSRATFGLSLGEEENVVAVAVDVLDGILAKKDTALVQTVQEQIGLSKVSKPIQTESNFLYENRLRSLQLPAVLAKAA
ncbi:MAG: 50S ribosomal protein L11 methyltransferase [Candidatus Omnitrophica bacterium]|nr:50S ribosomal protein L11 methyltransferase [Candidatus Omnitrophota bacterium]